MFRISSILFTAPTGERELVELAQLPRRWFDRIREFVETESEFVAG
jgi:hypothetical protein